MPPSAKPSAARHGCDANSGIKKSKEKWKSLKSRPQESCEGMANRTLRTVQEDGADLPVAGVLRAIVKPMTEAGACKYAAIRSGNAKKDLVRPSPDAGKRILAKTADAESGPFRYPARLTSAPLCLYRAGDCRAAAVIANDKLALSLLNAKNA